MNNPTFYKTIVNSPQWEKWEEENRRRIEEGGECFDVIESTETGWLSTEHWLAFLEFVKENK